MLDADQDGKISYQELENGVLECVRAVSIARGPPTPQLEDILAALRDHIKSNHDTVANTFKRADTDGSDTDLSAAAPAPAADDSDTDLST